MKLYLVGGIVRDFLLKSPVTGKDYDFAVEASSYDEMRQTLIDEYDAQIWMEHRPFLTLRAKVRLEIGSFGGLINAGNARDRASMKNAVYVDADFTMCRIDGQYSDQRHPDKVTPGTLFDDLSRRDFTVNAAAVAEDGTFYDPHLASLSVQRWELTCVGNAKLRLREDPLRVLRAVRMTVLHKLTMDDGLRRELDNHTTVAGLATLPSERVREELNKCLAADWDSTLYYIFVAFPLIRTTLRDAFPNLWFKATTETR